MLELTRQALRWLSIYLISLGLPAQIAAAFDSPALAAEVLATVSLALAEGGWLVVKAKQFRAWVRARSFWGT